MAEALSGALGNADAGTLALIQQLVEEKRKALEAVAPRVSLQSCLSGEAAAAPSAEAPSFAEVAAEIERPHRSQPIAPQMPFRQPSYAAPTGSAAEPVDLSANEVAPRQEAHYNVHDAYPPAAGVEDGSYAAGSDGASHSLHRSSEAAQLRAMRLQQELLLREAEECTFHPKTNSSRPTTRVSVPDGYFNRSQQWQDQVKEENEKRKHKLEQERNAECTFTPRVTTRRKSAGNNRKSAAGGSSADAGGEVPPDIYAEAQTPATPSVVSRLYQPQAAYLRHQQHERMREESRQQELEQCSFKPEINPPLRSNVATNVASRYRKPSPAKSRHLPTGAAECTFSPAVNRTPRALSSAVAEYLDDPAHMRLSRAPGTPRLESSTASSDRAGRGMTRSASAAPWTGPAAPSPGGSEAFSSFLERQQAHLQRKKIAEEKRAEAVEAERQAQLAAGPHGKAKAAAAAAGGIDGGSSQAGEASFLDRVAEAVRRRHEMGSRTDSELPTNHAEHCSFRPQITQAAHARKPRSVAELSLGDAARRARKADARRAITAAESEEGLTFTPAINEVPGVQSRLKVASEPGSYLARVRQHMKLKEQLTACVREAQESQELAECTFRPATHEAPAYITRIAKSVRLAKSAQPPPPPKQPEWR
jgi:hypothetical protein